MTPAAPPEHQFHFHAPFAPNAVPKAWLAAPPAPCSLTVHGPSRSLPSAAAQHRRVISFIFKLAPRRQIESILCHVLLPRNWKRLVTPHRRLLRRLWPHACPAPALRGFRSLWGHTAPGHTLFQPLHIEISVLQLFGFLVWFLFFFFGGSHAAFSTLSWGISSPKRSVF